MLLEGHSLGLQTRIAESGDGDVTLLNSTSDTMSRSSAGLPRMDSVVSIRTDDEIGSDDDADGADCSMVRTGGTSAKARLGMETISALNSDADGREQQGGGESAAFKDKSEEYYSNTQWDEETND